MGDIGAALSDPDVSGIVIWGVPGVGKSRLAREAMDGAAARGGDTRWIVGTSAGRSIPLGAFTAWTQPGVTDTVQLVRGVIESLTAAGPGTVIVVDDAHRLDDLSAFVVNQIVQRRAAKVILTVVDGEPIELRHALVHTSYGFAVYMQVTFLDDDDCSNECLLASCGDGIVQASEQCDDGNAVEGDGCTGCALDG